VWVANRAAPISDLSSAMLALHSSTNLVLSDANGRVLWNSNNSIAISASPATTVSAEATLENTGNFILLSNVNRTTLWQSFDHPSDTLLPGMKLRISHKMHPIQHLISWNGLQDPSPGVFSYMVQTPTVFCSSSFGMAQDRTVKAQCGLAISFLGATWTTFILPFTWHYIVALMMRYTCPSACRLPACLC